jgi:hypothetical protein
MEHASSMSNTEQARMKENGNVAMTNVAMLITLSHSERKEEEAEESAAAVFGERIVWSKARDLSVSKALGETRTLLEAKERQELIMHNQSPLCMRACACESNPKPTMRL